MPNTLPPDLSDLDAVSVADVLAHPQFDPRVRAVIHAIDTRVETLTIAEIASILDLDPSVIALQLANGLIAGEIERIRALDAASVRGLN